MKIQLKLVLFVFCQNTLLAGILPIDLMMTCGKYEIITEAIKTELCSVANNLNSIKINNPYTINIVTVLIRLFDQLECPVLYHDRYQRQFGRLERKGVSSFR